MNPQDIKKAIWQTVQECRKTFVYITIDPQGYPRGRYMGGLMVKNGIIYMATFGESRKIKQLKDNPRSELLFATVGYKKIVSLGGDSRVETSLPLKQEFWDANPSCKEYFSSPKAAEFGLIAFVPHSGEYLDLDVQHMPSAVTLP